MIILGTTGQFPSGSFEPVVEVASECTAGWVFTYLMSMWKSSLLASHFAQGVFSAVSLLVWSVKVLSGIGQHLSTWLQTECPADC